MLIKNSELKLEEISQPEDPLDLQVKYRRDSLDRNEKVVYSAAISKIITKYIIHGCLDVDTIDDLLQQCEPNVAEASLLDGKKRALHNEDYARDFDMQERLEMVSDLFGANREEALTRELKSIIKQESQNWRLGAACLGISPRVFFPEEGDSNNTAIEICLDCPVRSECLDYALTLNQTDDRGVWGGMSERQRRRIRMRTRPSQ